MSIKKITEREFSEVIERIMDIGGLSQESQVAELLNYSPQALSQSKKRGSLPINRMLRVCKEKGWNFDWIVSGDGQKFIQQTVGSGNIQGKSFEAENIHIDIHNGHVQEHQAGYEPRDPVEDAFLTDWRSLRDVVKMRIWTLVKEEKEKIK